MRIDANLGGLEGLHNDAVTRSKPRQVIQQGAQTEDVATFSTDGISISDLSAKALSAPEIRMDRVETLRQQIASGTYQPDPRRIASAMMNDLLAR